MLLEIKFWTTFLVIFEFFNTFTTIGAYLRPSDCNNQKKRSNTFLWTIESPDQISKSYFFGTIHVPYTHVWDYVSPTVKMAFQHSNSIFFELALHNPDTIRTLSQCQLLPKGESLENNLPKSLFKRLEIHMEYVRKNLPSWLPASPNNSDYADYIFQSIAGGWQQRRPVWILLMLNSLTKSDIENRGIPVLDLYLAQEAQMMAKDLGAVERPEEQCLPLNSLNASEVNFALEHTLRRHEKLRIDSFSNRASTSTSDLIKHYNCGSLDASVFNRDTIQLPEIDGKSSESSLEKARQIDSYFRHELIDKRNLRMAERVLWLLKNHPEQTFFFAFGAGHFLGENSVLDLVGRAGFKVKPVFEQKLSKKQKIEPQNAWLPYPNSLNRRRYERRRTANQRQPKFQDLWVRIEDFSPKPWQEIELESTKTTVSNARFYRMHKSRASSQVSPLIFIILLLFFTWFR